MHFGQGETRPLHETHGSAEVNELVKEYLCQGNMAMKNDHIEGFFQSKADLVRFILTPRFMRQKARLTDEMNGRLWLELVNYWHYLAFGWVLHKTCVVVQMNRINTKPSSVELAVTEAIRRLEPSSAEAAKYCIVAYKIAIAAYDYPMMTHLEQVADEWGLTKHLLPVKPPILAENPIKTNYGKKVA